MMFSKYMKLFKSLFLGGTPLFKRRPVSNSGDGSSVSPHPTWHWDPLILQEIRVRPLNHQVFQTPVEFLGRGGQTHQSGGHWHWQSYALWERHPQVGSPGEQKAIPLFLLRKLLLGMIGEYKKHSWAHHHRIMVVMGGKKADVWLCAYTLWLKTKSSDLFL